MTSNSFLEKIALQWTSGEGNQTCPLGFTSYLEARARKPILHSMYRLLLIESALAGLFPL